MKPYLASIALLISILALAVGQDQQASVTLGELLTRNSYRIDQEGRLGGPGLEWLLAEAAGAQFVVLGEPHNVKQVPEFTTALFRELHARHGYKYLALEQDPYIIDAMSRQAGLTGREGVFELAARYPSSLHFYTDQELQMIADVGAIAGSAIPRVWGVDRTLSSVPALDQLSGSVSSPELAARLTELAARAREFNLAHLLKRERLMGTRFELFESLPEQAAGENETVRWGLDWLARSSRNIRLYVEHSSANPTGFQSNLEREEMMKDAFLRRYREAVAAGDTLPKVIIKSGHVHTARGLSRVNTYTLGNLASELARSNGLNSLHIDISVINRPGQHWSLSDYEDYAPLTAVSSPDRWTLVDLRPLRPYLHSRIFEVSPELRDKVFASDLALVLGNTQEGSIEWAAPLIEAAQQKQ